MARQELKNTAYEIFVGLLSVLSILNIALLYASAEDPAIQQILLVMNGLFSIIFIADFLYRFFTASSGWTYFFRQFGWADLLASLPLPNLKLLRLFRVFRVVRLLHQVGWRRFVRTLVKDRAGGTMLTLLLMGVLVLEFGSMGMLAIEQNAPGSNITNGANALWYTIVTISTVGYGDHYPVTPTGQALGTFIIIVGVGIFGTFTGYLANFFLAPQKSESDEESPGALFPEQVGVQASQTDQLRLLLRQSETTVAELRRMLEDSREAGEQGTPDPAG